MGKDGSGTEGDSKVAFVQYAVLFVKLLSSNNNNNNNNNKKPSYMPILQLLAKKMQHIKCFYLQKAFAPGRSVFQKKKLTGASPVPIVGIVSFFFSTRKE
jgi:hypothetical protein